MVIRGQFTHLAQKSDVFVLLVKVHFETVKLPFVSVSQMNVERRLFFFRFGDPQARMNWVHVDNLILAHRLAAEALSQQRDYISVSVS